MTKAKPLPDREWLLENLRYEPDTGLFWWVKKGPGRRMSKPAGSESRRKERGSVPACIQIAFGSPPDHYVAHRLAWLMMTGEDPAKLTVDHINRNPFDNKWQNLRLADATLQMRNRRNFGASKHKGVHYRSDSRKWRACVRIDGKLKNLGTFATEEEAAIAAAPYFIH